MIREKIPDKLKIKSMLEAAARETNFIKTLTPSKDSAITIISRIYENFRMLGDSLMLTRGKEAMGLDHHTEMINELLTLNVKTKRPLEILNSLKSLRNSINYRGYLPSVEEAKDALFISDSLFVPLITEIKKELEKLR